MVCCGVLLCVSLGALPPFCSPNVRVQSRYLSNGQDSSLVAWQRAEESKCWLITIGGIALLHTVITGLTNVDLA